MAECNWLTVNSALVLLGMNGAGNRLLVLRDTAMPFVHPRFAAFDHRYHIIDTAEVRRDSVSMCRVLFEDIVVIEDRPDCHHPSILYMAQNTKDWRAAY